MRKSLRIASFFLGLLLALIAITWLTMLASGPLPSPGPQRGDLIVSICVVSPIAAGLVWFGLDLNARIFAAPLEVQHAQREATPVGMISKFFAWLRARREATIARREAEKARLEAEITHAQSGELVPVYSGSLVLHGDEKAFASIGASLLDYRTVGYRGGSTGVSVRVARGVYLRQSGSRGTAQKALVPIASGTLFATSKQIAFVGDLKSVSVPLQKVVSFEPLLDGVRLGNASKTFIFATGTSHNLKIFQIIAQRLLSEQT